MIEIKEKYLYIRGARNLIKSLDLKNERSLIVLSNEDNKEFSNYVLEAAKQEEINNVVYIVIPEIFRPITKIPALLINAIKKAKGEKVLDAIEFLKLVKQKAGELKFDEKILSRQLNVGFSGGEKKKNEIL